MKKLRWLIVLALVLFGAPNTRAADGTWNNPAGGDWGTAGNWVDGIIPGADDVAIFPDLGSTVSVTGGGNNMAGLTFDSPHSYTVAGSTNNLSHDFTWTVLQGQHEVDWRIEPGANNQDVVMDVAVGAQLTWTNIIYEYQPPDKRTGVVKNGDGTAVMTGGEYGTVIGEARQYRRDTVVNAGTLLVNNTEGLGISKKSTVQVNDGGTLGGTGFIGQAGWPGLVNVYSGGTIAPGAGVGTLTLNNGLTLFDGSKLDFELGTLSDLIDINGGTFTGCDSANGVTVSIADSGGLLAGNIYDLIDWNGATASGVEVDDFQMAAGEYADSLLGISDGKLQVTVVGGLIWDGADSTWEFGAGKNSHWEGADPGDIPTADSAAAVPAGVCTVDDTQQAGYLVVRGSGTVAIAPTGNLTVTKGVNVSSGGFLTVEGSLAAGSLTTAGTTTFASAIAGIPALRVTDGSAALAGGALDSLTVTGGSLSTSAELNVDNMVFTAGALDTTTTQVAIQDGGSLTVPNETFTVAGATMGVSGSGVPDEVVVNILGGEVTVSGPVPTDPLFVDTDVAATGNAFLALGVQSGDLGPPFPSVTLAKLTLDLDVETEETLTVRLEPPVVAQADRSASFEELTGSGKLQWDGGDGQFAVTGVVSPGGSSSGVMVISDKLIMEPDSTYQWGLDTAGEDALFVGHLDLAPGGSWTLKLDNENAPSGHYGEAAYIISYGTLEGDSLGEKGIDYFIDTTQAENWVFPVEGPSLSKDIASGFIALVGLERILELQWQTDANESYNNPDNWFNQALPDAVDAEANFLDDIPFTDDRRVTIDGPVTIGTIKFKNATKSFTLAGSADPGDVITLETSSGTPQINVEAGAHTITAPLSFTAATVDTQDGTSLTLTQNGIVSGELTKAGLGSLALGDGVILTGGLNHNGGVLEVGPGVLAQPGGDVSLGDGVTLRASGMINRLVYGDVTTEILPTDNLIIGAVSGGYTYGGQVQTGTYTVLLFEPSFPEKDATGTVVEGGAKIPGAVLGGGTATLSSSNGIHLLGVEWGPNMEKTMLKGEGTVHGWLAAGNPVDGLGWIEPGDGNKITFTGNLQGSYAVVGDVEVLGLEIPSWSPGPSYNFKRPMIAALMLNVAGSQMPYIPLEVDPGDDPIVTDPDEGYSVAFVSGGNPATGETLLNGLITMRLDPDEVAAGNPYEFQPGDRFYVVWSGPSRLSEDEHLDPAVLKYGPSFGLDLPDLSALGLQWNPPELTEQYVKVSIVPEPSTLLLLATGGVFLLACAWRRRRAA